MAFIEHNPKEFQLMIDLLRQQDTIKMSAIDAKEAKAQDGCRPSRLPVNHYVAEDFARNAKAAKGQRKSRPVRQVTRACSSSFDDLSAQRGSPKSQGGISQIVSL